MNGLTGLTWGAASLGLLAAAIAVPALVILYFLKLRRRTVEVSSTLLWKKAVRDMQANAPFQRLRRNILLLLQLLALAAALLAVAQPREQQTADVGSRRVLMLDRSASMGAVDDPADGRTRLELAQQAAIEQIDQLRQPGLLGRSRADEAMVVAFDTSAEVVSPFTADRAALRAAIESITQTDAASNAAEAFKIAQANRPRRTLLDNAGGTAEDRAFEVDGLVGGPPMDFHLFTDGRVRGLDSVDPDTADSFTYHSVGRPDAVNLALVSLRAERGYENPQEISIFVGVQSTDRLPRAADIELALDGRGVVAIKRVELPPAPPASPDAPRPQPGTAGVVFELTEPAGLVATITLRAGDLPDALLADNISRLVIPPARRTSVAIVTPGNLFLREALGGLPLARLDVLAPAAFDDLVRSGQSALYDVVLLDGHLPPAPPGAPLPPGRWLVLNSALPGVLDPIDDAQEGPPAAILDYSRTHPVLRDVAMDVVRIARMRRTVPAEGAGVAVLAETTAGPALAEASGGSWRALVVPFDLTLSNWPFDVGFVVFLASSVDYLTGGAAADTSAAAGLSLAPGDVLSARLPDGASDARVYPPAPASVSEVAVGPDGSIAWGPVERAGFYRLRWLGPAGPIDAADGGSAERLLAANLLNPDESDLATIDELGLASRVVTASAARGVREYWPWLVLAALALLMLEWWIYNRRVSL